jgi:uncharacterized damage-inducible protein DinB
MKQTKWFERKFDFSQTENIFPSILERLRGAPIRLADKLTYISTPYLILREGETWTIAENIGHLSDLEPLWQGRLQDILKGETYLRPTDLANTRTSEARHNEQDLAILLKKFNQLRAETLHMLEKISEEQVFQAALHPRLHTPMRTMDLFQFVAEHDDHHLARIEELYRKFAAVE